MKGSEKQIKWAQDIMAKVVADVEILEQIASGAQPIFYTGKLKRGEQMPEGHMSERQVFDLVKNVATLGRCLSIRKESGFDLMGATLEIIGAMNSRKLETLVEGAGRMAEVARRVLGTVENASSWINLHNQVGTY